MKPQPTPKQQPLAEGNHKRRRGLYALFAVGVVLLIVAAGFFAATYLLGQEAASEGNEPLDAAHADAMHQLAQLGAPLPPTDAVVADAKSEVEAIESEADHRMTATIEDAEMTLRATTSDVHPYLAGADGGVTLDMVLAAAAQGHYAVDEARADLEGQSSVAFRWTSDPSSVSYEDLSITYEPTGHQEVDDALAELAAQFEAVKVLWGSEDVQVLFATAEENGVAVPGLVKAPFGADDYVEPDESGALDAQAHADAFLGTVEGGYGDLESGLGEIQSVQDDLVSKAQEGLAGAEAYGDDARAELDAELRERLAAVQLAAADYQAAVEAAAEAHATAAAEAQAEAIGRVDAEAATQTEAIESTAADAQARLDELAATARSEADSRIAAIDAHEAQVLADLELAAASGADVSSKVEAYMAAAADARASMEAQAAYAEAQAAEAKAEIEARAEAAKADVESRAAALRSEAETIAADAEAFATAAKAQALADFDTHVGAAMQAEAQAHALATAAIDEFVLAAQADIRAQADELVAQARADAMAAIVTVDAVQAESITEISKDLEYIQKVADDYAAVPTPERTEAAELWYEAHATVQGSLGARLSEGDRVMSAAGAVLVSADAAAAGLAAL